MDLSLVDHKARMRHIFSPLSICKPPSVPFVSRCVAKTFVPTDKQCIYPDKFPRNKLAEGVEKKTQ